MKDREEIMNKNKTGRLKKDRNKKEREIQTEKNKENKERKSVRETEGNTEKGRLSENENKE